MANARELGAMETKVAKALQAFACLLNRPDLNTNGWPISEFGGTPSSTLAGCPTPNAADTQISVQGPTEPTSTTVPTGLNLVGLQRWPRRLWTLPEHRGIAPNSQQAFAQPPAPQTPPLTTQAHTQAAKTLAATAAASTNPAPASCPPYPTTGNVCLDLMLNYTDPSQVSPTQLIACSNKGYAGVKNGPLLTTQMIQCRAANYATLPKVADQPNVPQYNASTMGMGDYDGCAFIMNIIAAGVGTAMALWLLNEARKQGAFAF